MTRHSHACGRFHNSPIGGHSGIVTTLLITISVVGSKSDLIGARPHLKKEVSTFLHECAVCQRVKGEHCHYPGLLDPLPLPISAWTDICLDLF